MPAKDTGHHKNKQEDQIRAMLLLSDMQPGCRILDAGCGNGVLVPYLLAYRPREILAVDRSEERIASAKSRIWDPRVTFRREDILEIEDFVADSIFLYNTLPHFMEPSQVVNHLAGLLRPGGRITVSHTQGIFRSRERCQEYEPALLLKRLLEPVFHLDTVVDNNAMLLVSGQKRG